MEIQGPGLKIDLVIIAIRSSRLIHIKHTDVISLPPVPEETEFISQY